MENKEVKLEVKNLRVSFRTVSGKVQAVRDISFKLNKGETLAIVGESGSGKSVTSKAILGILAGNSIVEGGEIIYDGKDLLKIPEEEFYRIRGDRIAMIFQDPLSSLNPIMRIGKQLTEAMLLKGKARQKASREAFNGFMKLLDAAMVEAVAKGDAARAAEIHKKCKNFDTFEIKHTKLELVYNKAREAASEAVTEFESLLFLIDKKATDNYKTAVKEYSKLALAAVHPFVVNGDEASELKNRVSTMPKNPDDAVPNIKRILEILNNALSKEEPNYFSIGYYLTFSGENVLPDMPVDKLNAYLHEYLDNNFMLAFIDDAQKAVEYSAQKHKIEKLNAIEKLTDAIENADKYFFSGVRNAKKHVSELSDEIERSIDKMEIIKDSMAYIFKSGLEDAVNVYYLGLSKNGAEQKKHDKQQASYDKFIAKKGKEPDWKPVPAAIIDLELAKNNVITILNNLKEHYTESVAKFDSRDFRKETIAIIDYFKECASGVVNKITRRMARMKAIKLMEEVGIPEARKRYNQYPFEFSGGMRQRIVIAIALAANPDILICDEPTTALDVTIQAQILELINKLKKERNLSIIFITHDLGVVANMADNIAVMYAGKIVEYGTSNDIFYDPIHPYTWALLASMPDLDTNEKLEAIPGTPPNMIYPPVGDAFAERNKYALQIDFEQQPPMFDVSETHKAATWLLHPNAPKIDPPRIVTERIRRMKNMGGDANE